MTKGIYLECRDGSIQESIGPLVEFMTTGVTDSQMIRYLMIDCSTQTVDAIDTLLCNHILLSGNPRQQSWYIPSMPEFFYWTEFTTIPEIKRVAGLLGIDVIAKAPDWLIQSFMVNSTSSKHQMI